MKNILKKIGSLALAGSLIFGVGAGVALATGTPLRVVQTPSIHLYAGIVGGSTSMRITPFPKDLDGTKLTLTDFGSSTTLTIDPKVSGYEEIIGFSGLVDNGDNTATLTGLSRNLISKYPYTTVGTGRSHGAGATIVFGNNPQIYGRLGALENDQSWLGINTFSSTTQPRYDFTPATYNGTSFVSYATLLATAIQGAATSTFSNMGIVKLATKTEIAAGTASSTTAGTTGAPLVIPAKFATSTPNAGLSANLVPITNSNGVLNPLFIATSSTDAPNGYSFTAPITVTSASTTLNATTTIAGNTSNKLTINTVPYVYPSANSIGVMSNDGSGNLSWGGTPQYTYGTNTNFGTVNAYATSTILTIPAGFITASSTISVTGNANCALTGGSASCTFYLRDSTGVTLASFTSTCTASCNIDSQFTMRVVMANLVSSQLTTLTGFSRTNAGVVSVIGAASTDYSSSINMANAVGLALVAYGPDSATTPVVYNFNIVVNK